MGEDIVENFFSMKFENEINEKSLYYAFDFPVDSVKRYIYQLNNEPVCLFVDHLLLNTQPVTIYPRDVFQFSKFEDATFNLCEKIKEASNPGLKFLEIGKILLDDGKIRSDDALIKYGENHVKTATKLGLCFELSRTYFLSCIGMLYFELDDMSRDKILLRLILRDKFMGRLIRSSKNGKVDLRSFLYMISDSTYVRRRSNIKRIWEVLINSNEYDFLKFYDNIIF